MCTRFGYILFFNKLLNLPKVRGTLQTSGLTNIQTITFCTNMPNTNVKKEKGGSCTDRSSKWPSQHCVVNFLHPDCSFVDVKSLTTNIGTIKSRIIMPHENMFVTKVEMSNSNEAEMVWKEYSDNPPSGIIAVVPDDIKTLYIDKNLSKRRFKSHSTPQHKDQHYSEYLPNSLVQQGIEKGEIISGAIRINAKKYVHAFVPDEDGRDILIDGMKDRNRALDGDIVAVKIKPKSEWVVGTNDISSSEIDTSRTDNVCADSQNLSVKQKSDVKNDKSSIIETKFNNSRKTGTVVAILDQRHNRITTGIVKLDVFKKNNALVLFSPTSSTFPRLIMQKQSFKDHLSNPDISKILFVAKLKDWRTYQKMPDGELCEVIGKSGDIEAETARILIDHNIENSEFPDGVTKCLPTNLPWSIPMDERSKRKDFTSECIFTIDPLSAKDLDDALHCKQLPNGTFEVGVHIADVSHFVKPLTELDEIARKRCTSVYLVQKVIPMLPQLLCEELCSLNPGKERLAFSVVWTFTESGKILSEWFGKSIIQSCMKLSYDHAQSIINNHLLNLEHCDDFPTPIDNFPEIIGGFSRKDIQKRILNLFTISQHLRKRRIDKGALQLDQVRLSYILQPETGFPTGCYAYERKNSNELIEEFMLLANMAVAHKLYKNIPSQAFLRCHPPPKETMMEDVVNHCNAIGLNIDSSSSGALATTLSAACGDDELSRYKKQVLFMLAIKPQQLATYVCAGTESDESKYHHYALNVPLYTHFTSPIRRYADVIVHRQLQYVLDGNEETIEHSSSEELQKQADLCNERKSKAKSAQDASIDLFFNLLVNNYGPLESTSMVMYVNDHSVDVLSMEYGVMKRIYFDAMSGVRYKFEEILSTGQHLKINVLKLKWLKNSSESVSHEDCDMPYDDVEGTEQILQVFSIVKILLMKQEPESATSIKAILVNPANPPLSNVKIDEVLNNLKIK